MSTTLKNPILMAVLGGAHGLKGEVRAQSFTDDPLAVGSYGPLFDAAGRRFDILGVKPAKTVVLLRLKDVVDRNAAEALNGVELFIERDDMPDEALAEDEFYQSDLVGLEAVDAEGGQHGKVVAIHDFGGGTILELQTSGQRSVMIPFSEAAVTAIDLAGGRMMVDPVAAGLVDDGEGPEGEPAKAGSGSRRRRPPSKDGGAS